jgi:hypothetical protein
MSEHDNQVALFEWARVSINTYPELSNMFAIPNGGARHIGVAIKLKKEGVKRGVPDIFLAVPNHKHHGLFIELKHGSNKLTDEQKAWREKLELENYKHVTCKSWIEASEEIKKYLEHRDD